MSESAGTSRHQEVERKFEPGRAVVLPSLADVEGVFAVGQPVEAQLDAVYFDTADLDLAQRRVTVRRRTGGDDAGWHLKLPEGADARTEVRLPLGRATKTVPAGLLAPVRAVVRDRRLTPVAHLRTRRLEYPVLGKDAVVLATVCDDEVQAERSRAPGGAHTWREWEVELVRGDRALLDALGRRLLEAGAAPGTPSKLVRTLGDLVPQAPPRPSRRQLAQGSAAQLVQAHLAEHVEQLHRQDARLREELPGSVHKMRIAARRLRSALKTYRPLLVADAADQIGEELRWLGQVLAKARDAQVLREHLGQLVAAEPAELVLGPVARRIEDDLRAEYRTGVQEGLAMLSSPRYFRLLDSLDELVRPPVLSEGAHDPATRVVPHVLGRDSKRLRRAVRRIAGVKDPGERDQALHEARKKAKRLRYAAESAVPVFPGKAGKLAAAAKRVQEALGEHQDAVVSRSRLREYGVRAHLSGENGFTFGRLHALEQARADDAVRRFESAWGDLERHKPERWKRT
jgi:CHAD domain-containing protein